MVVFFSLPEPVSDMSSLDKLNQDWFLPEQWDLVRLIVLHCLLLEQSLILVDNNEVLGLGEAPNMASPLCKTFTASTVGKISRE